MVSPWQPGHGVLLPAWCPPSTAPQHSSHPRGSRVDRDEVLLVLVAVTRPLGDVGDVHHCSDTEVAPRHPQTVIHAQNKMVEEGEGRESPQGFGDTSAALCWGSPVPGQGGCFVP